MVIYISVHIFKEAPQLEIGELAAYDEHVYMVTIHSNEPPYEVNFYFHGRDVFNKFIAQLETWFAKR
jgi:S-adenosylmethionine hydrolase